LLNTLTMKFLKWIIKHWIITIIAIFIIVGAISGDYTTKSIPQPIRQPVSPSMAFKLASIESGLERPDQQLVAQFDSVLSKLKVKCPTDTKDQLGGFIFVGRDTLADKGLSYTLIEVANGIEGSIPDDIQWPGSCAEVAASFVTLVDSN